MGGTNLRIVAPIFGLSGAKFTNVGGAAGMGENLPYYFHPEDVAEMERRKKQGVPANAVTA